jgi:hypothetical protein
MTPTVLALDLVDTSLPVKVLAAIGGATVGALLLGWVVQLVVKLAFVQKVPPWALWPIRLLGGVACGLLVWSLFGGTGGWLFGGGGGPGGDGADKDKTKEQRREKDRGKEKGKAEGKRDTSPARPGSKLSVEVLGDADLKRIAGSKFDPKKRYRIQGQPGLLNLAEVQKVIRERHEGKPPLREVDVVLYKDSPARDKEQVKALADYAGDLGGKEDRIKVNYSIRPDQDAPPE